MSSCMPLIFNTDTNVCLKEQLQFLGLQSLFFFPVSKLLLNKNKEWKVLIYEKKKKINLSTWFKPNASVELQTKLKDE